MSAEKQTLDGVERRIQDAPEGVTALKQALRGMEQGLDVDQLYTQNEDPAQNHVREEDFANSHLRGKVGALLKTAIEDDEPGKTAAPALTPEQLQEAWLSDFEIRFTTSTELHEGIEWINVKNSLKKDPESVRRLMAFDAKGHNMNVLGETPEEFIFVSSWTDYNQVSPDHRTITYDTKGQELAESMGGHRPNGNAVKIIADIMGIKEEEAVNYLADEKFHEQLIKAIGVNGWAWLKTDPEYREKTDNAVYGYRNGFAGNDADLRNRNGSFRAALRVKKA